MLRVHQSYSIWVEAAFEPSLNAPQPPAQGEGVKQLVGRMGGVPHVAGCCPLAPADVNVLNATGDLLSSFQHSLQRLAVSRAVSIPSCNGEGKSTLHHTLVESSQH